ncbi:MAG: hypothetical protein WCG27_06025 [Pseudomonadota bacterium]
MDNAVGQKKINTLAQKEALINECKGNLFEYLVGHELARHFAIEPLFILSLGPKTRQRLAHYENFLRPLGPQLVKALPLWAKKAAQELIVHLPQKITGILVVGKLGKEIQREWKEADLLLENEELKFPISLKLGKEQSYVNTKSAGIRSFLKKYFAVFVDAPVKQNEIDRLVGQTFHQMGHELYALAELGPFNGHFGREWEESGYSHLPGELPPEMKKIVCNYYAQIVGRIYQVLREWFDTDRARFISCLYPMLGAGRSEVMQLTCFYQKKDYQLSSLRFADANLWAEQLGPLQFGEIKSGIASFPLIMKNCELQIRMKPMNVFTVPALKVNCSIKKSD